MADSTTNIDNVLVSQSSKEVVVNADMNATSPAAAFGRRDSSTVALTWGFYGGRLAGDVGTFIPNGTIALSASSTNYLYITSTGTMTKVTSPPGGWPDTLAAGAIAIAQVVTGPSTISTWDDLRPWNGGSGGGGGGGTTYQDFVGDAGSPGGGVHGLVPAPAIGDAAAGKVLFAGGTWQTPASIVPDFVGDVGSPGGGVHGLVPAPAVGDGTYKFLKADGTWARPQRPPIQFACSDQSTPLNPLGSPTVPAIVFRALWAFTIASVRASLNTASGSGVVTVDIWLNGSSIFSTLLTIDASERTSMTAATPAVLSTTSIADDDEFEVYITTPGSGAVGLVVSILPA